MQSGIADKLIDSVRDLCMSLKASNPSVDPSARLGALFTEGSAENVLRLVLDAKEAGAVYGCIASFLFLIRETFFGGIEPKRR